MVGKLLDALVFITHLFASVEEVGGGAVERENPQLAPLADGVEVVRHLFGGVLLVPSAGRDQTEGEERIYPAGYVPRHRLTL